MTRFYDACNDVAFKKIFLEHPERTVSFLNAVLHLKEERRIRKVEFLPQECLPLIAESKKSILDVRVTDQRNFQYIVEVQNRSLGSYIKRIQYYASHVYVGQMKRAEDYGSLKPVTVLSIQNHLLFPDDVPCISFHRNREESTGNSYLSDMAYAFVELPKFTKREEEVESREEHWVYLLKNAKDMDHIPENAPEEIRSAFRVLEEHTWSEPEREAYLKARMAMMDDQDAIQTAQAKGEAIGEARGEARGKAEGIAEGEIRGRVKFAREMGLSEDEIAQRTGISLETVQEILAQG